ncbi:sigma-70 family RNA polymerase sigma factor [Mangrovibacillus sp. Mu-81]|uniref:sigma-70 family RNA polymerase sigma factor n=1 Tax=Mangrovibacillus sp. Mu-81 TaxID=3121478 RepID=UPI002FE4701C
MESFDSVYKQYEGMIHKIIRSLNIYKNKEEFYQTGLIALWEAHENFDPVKGTFPPYAYSYIRGRILSALTRDSRTEERTVFPSKEEFWELIEDDHPIEALTRELLLSYCDELTENQTKWVVYTSLHMLTISEISDLENVSISAVKKWRKGAREKLRD